MRIVIAGGSGFLGQALTHALIADGHDIRILTRHPRTPNDVAWNPARQDESWTSHVREADVIVNLAGESIAGRRWSPARKVELRNSRMTATAALASTVLSAPQPPIMISASAVGFYGTNDGRPMTEESPAGSDFLARLCEEWEAAALTVAGVTRVVLLRTGIVLGTGGGALPQLTMPFRFFAGGPIGSGRQFVSWIHVDDWVGLVRWAIINAAVAGPLNLTAPNPVTNADLADALGRAMGRPSFLPAPAFAIRLVVGEMADAGILNGQRVLPAKALALGYRFGYPEVGAALTQIFAAET